MHQNRSKHENALTECARGSVAVSALGRTSTVYALAVAAISESVGKAAMQQLPGQPTASDLSSGCLGFSLVACRDIDQNGVLSPAPVFALCVPVAGNGGSSNVSPCSAFCTTLSGALGGSAACDAPAAGTSQTIPVGNHGDNLSGASDRG